MMNKCLGCGIKLQTDNPKLIGYTPKEEATYCERCFRLKNYNEYKEVELLNINEKILDTINKEKQLTIFLLDFLNINRETISTFKKITAPKILIISKKDIIPNSIKEDTISTFIKKIYQIEEDIYFLSSLKKYNLEKIINKIADTNEKKAYIVGYTNSGKSTFINTITKKFNGKSLITTSSIPNTTLDYINISIDSLTIVDTPGFTMEKSIYDKKDYDLIKRMNPKSYLKPLTYQTKENTGILIENKLYLKPNNLNSLTFYISNNIMIEKIYSDKPLKEDYFTINIPNNSDLVIIGLGFVNIKKECNLTINATYKELIEVRTSLFYKEI